MSQVLRAMPGVIEWKGADIVRFFFVFVVADDVTFAVRINDVPVAGIGHDETAFAPASLKPIFSADYARIGPTGDAHIRIVLLSAVDVIRERIIDSNVVKLRRRLIALARPSFAAVS